MWSGPRAAPSHSQWGVRSPLCLERIQTASVRQRGASATRSVSAQRIDPREPRYIRNTKKNERCSFSYQLSSIDQRAKCHGRPRSASRSRPLSLRARRAPRQRSAAMLKVLITPMALHPGRVRLPARAGLLERKAAWPNIANRRISTSRSLARAG